MSTLRGVYGLPSLFALLFAAYTVAVPTQDVPTPELPQPPLMQRVKQLEERVNYQQQKIELLIGEVYGEPAPV